MLLNRYVDADGWIDYGGMKTQESDLDQYLSALGRATLDDLGRDERLALLINAYNACTLKLILDYYPLESIRDIPVSKRWHIRKHQKCHSQHPKYPI